MQHPIWLVYHRLSPSLVADPALWPERHQHYKLVALIQAATLAEVLRLTNRFEGDWRQNALVRDLASAPPRSTSTGDVIASGACAWMVRPSGFLPLKS